MNRLIQYPIKIPDNKHGPPGKKCSSEFSVLSSEFGVRGSRRAWPKARENGDRKPEIGDLRTEKTCMNEVVCRRGLTFGAARVPGRRRGRSEIGDRRPETGENLYERGSLLARFDVHCWTVAESRHRRESQSSRFDV